MDFFAQYAVDPSAEEGKEFDFGGGVKMLIARGGNSKFRRMLNKQYEAHKHTLDLKDTPEQIAAAEECSNKLMANVMAHSILLGWTGPVQFRDNPKDKPYDLPYSKANAEKLLLMKEFQAEVAKKADDFKNFRFQTEEEDAKNSATTSAGTSSGVAESSTYST